MIIKNKSFYEKFVDWWNDFKKDKPLITGSANDMILFHIYFTFCAFSCVL